MWFRAAAKQSSFRWPREAQIDSSSKMRLSGGAAASWGLAKLKDDSKNDAVNNAAEYLFHGSATFPRGIKPIDPAAPIRQRDGRGVQRRVGNATARMLSSKRYGMFLALVDGIFKVLRKKMKEKVDQLLKEPESSASRKAIDEHFYKKWDNRVTTNVGDVGDTSVSRLRSSARITAVSLAECAFCASTWILSTVRLHTSSAAKRRSSAAPAPCAAVHERPPRKPMRTCVRNSRPPAAPHSELLVNPEPHRSNMDLLLLGEPIGATGYAQHELQDQVLHRAGDPGQQVPTAYGAASRTRRQIQPHLAASVVGGTDVDASLMATLEIVSRTCNLMAKATRLGSLSPTRSWVS